MYPYRPFYCLRVWHQCNCIWNLCNKILVSGSLPLCGSYAFTFMHAACLGLECAPSSNWLCAHCRDKFGPGRKVTGESRPIIIRLTRVVKAPSYESGGCVVCRCVLYLFIVFEFFYKFVCITNLIIFHNKQRAA